MRRDEFEETYTEIRSGNGAEEHLHRSLGSLIVELTRELRDLFVTEVALARSEVSTKVEQAAMGVASVVIGGATCLAGLMALVAAAVFALDRYWIHQPWLSALVVGVVVLGLGFALLALGKYRMEARKLVPKRSAENLHEDVRVLKQDYQRRI